MSSYNNYFSSDPKSIAGLSAAVDKLGQESYHTVQTIALYVCVLSLMGLFIARFIFRIANPKEDTKAKMYIQGILVTVIILCILVTLFAAIMHAGGSLK